MPGWWFGTFFIFPYVGNVIIPFDFHIFFKMVGQPPTRCSCSPINFPFGDDTTHNLMLTWGCLAGLTDHTSSVFSRSNGSQIGAGRLTKQRRAANPTPSAAAKGGDNPNGCDFKHPNGSKW